MQSRWTSLLEAAANVVAGLALSFILQLALFKVLGLAATFGRNLVMTAAFTALSLIRSYVLRRLFNRFGNRHRRMRTGRQLETDP